MKTNLKNFPKCTVQWMQLRTIDDWKNISEKQDEKLLLIEKWKEDFEAELREILKTKPWTLRNWVVQEILGED